MINATARPFRPDIVPPIVRPATFNDDLTIGSILPSKHVWSGEQRRGVAMHVVDATSIRDRVLRGLGIEFFLAKDIPLPGEINEAMTFMLSTPLSLRVEFWEDQLKRVKLVVDQAADLQRKWYQKVDPRTQSATGEI